MQTIVREKSLREFAAWSGRHFTRASAWNRTSDTKKKTAEKFRRPLQETEIDD